MWGQGERPGKTSTPSPSALGSMKRPTFRAGNWQTQKDLGRLANKV